MKKLLAILLSLTLMASTFTSCGSSDTPTTTPSGSGEETSEPMEISVSYWDIETALSGGENDKVLQTIQDKFNVKFVSKNISWDDYKQKTQGWAASDSLPDIFAIDAIGTANYHDWINGGLIKALPSDLSAYSNLESYLDVGDIQDLKIDDKLYCVPRKTYEDNYWNSIDRVVMYRWDLAQAAGVTTEPTNFDEFRAMVLKIIEADSEGKNIQGLTTTVPALIDGFLFNYSMPASMSDGSGSDFKWSKKDGKYEPLYFSQDMQSTFQLARDMYTEGSIEKDIALAKLQQSYDKFLTGQSAALLAGGGAQGQYNNVARNWQDANGTDFFEDVKFLNLIEGKDGQVNFSIFRTPWSETYISSKVDDAKLAKILEIFDYFISEEGRLLLNYGFEGEDYKITDGEIESLLDIALQEKYPFAAISGLVEWTTSIWNEAVPSAVPDDRYRQEDIKRYGQAVATGDLPEYDMRITYMSTPLKNGFSVRPTDDLLKIMMGSAPVDQMIAELMAEYEDKGLTAMIDEVNAEATKKGF